ncbi:hypothetical protein LCGC14_1286300 [marine sediment metagenome]|uniref:Uncharacterized protein n=1 Tax=marine sediment metagenome TaxID=412755 RepID=A0A0F9KVF0_9ZZZZ
MAKGADWERTVCKFLSKWWTDNKRDDIFWRTAGSGGRATMRQKQGKKTRYQYGDMTIDDPIGKPFIDFFLVEMKRGYSDLNFLSLIDGKQKKPELIEWWKKAEEEKELGDRKQTILILKRDYKIPIIIMTKHLFGLIEDYINVWEHTNVMDLYLDEKYNLTIVPLYPFLEYCDSKTMKLFMRNYNKNL